MEFAENQGVISSDIVSHEALQSLRAQSFFSHWQDMIHDDPVACRSHFDALDLGPWLGNILILDVIDGGKDFRYRLIGTRIVSASNRELTGSLVSEMEYEIGSEAMLERYRVVCDSREPIIRKGRFAWVPERSWRNFESVAIRLTLKPGSDQVDQLMVFVEFL